MKERNAKKRHTARILLYTRKKRLRISLTRFRVSLFTYDLLHNERTVLWSKPVSELRQVKRYRHISLSLYDRRFGSTRFRLSDKTIHVIYAKVVATYIDIVFGRVHFLSGNAHIHIRTHIHLDAAHLLPFTHPASHACSLSLLHCINILMLKKKGGEEYRAQPGHPVSSRAHFTLAISTLNIISFSATTYKR